MNRIQNISETLRYARRQYSRILWCHRLVPSYTTWGGYRNHGKILGNQWEWNFSTKSLCDLASVVLKENYFEHSSNICHPKLETAIGTEFAPPYANLFMAGLEKRIFENSGYHRYLWLRFLDDIFWWFKDGLEKLQEFFKFLSAFHPTIKFNMGEAATRSVL